MDTSERQPLAIDDEGPALLGSPHSSALVAYSHRLDHPLINDEESEFLGGQIYTGNMAARQLANPDPDTQVDAYFALQQQVEDGMAARRVVASRHLRMVASIAERFSFDAEQKAHMIGVGHVALMRCMRGYEHRQGRHITPFLQVSVTRGMIAEVIATQRQQTGRSHRMQRELREIDRAYEVSRALGEDATYLEISERLGFRPERIQRILRLSRIQTMSVDASFLNDSHRSIGDILVDTHATEELEAAENDVLLEQVWNTATELLRRQIITEREWKVLVSRYRDGLTQQAIADDWVHPITQHAIQLIEYQALRKIRQEIESPGCHEQALNPAFTLVETATDLLRVLGIPIDVRTDIKATARFIIDNSGLTQLQQVTMHALLGIYHRHFRPHEFAKLRGVAYRAVYDAREKAMRRLYATFGNLPEMGDLTTQEAIVIRADTGHAFEEETYDFEAALASMQLWARNETTLAGAGKRVVNGRIRKMGDGALLGLALELRPQGVMSKADVSQLAAEGRFLSLGDITERFGSLREFQRLCRELRALRAQLSG